MTDSRDLVIDLVEELLCRDGEHVMEALALVQAFKCGTVDMGYAADRLRELHGGAPQLATDGQLPDVVVDVLNAGRDMAAQLEQLKDCEPPRQALFAWAQAVWRLRRDPCWTSDRARAAAWVRFQKIKLDAGCEYFYDEEAWTALEQQLLDCGIGPVKP